MRPCESVRASRGALLLALVVGLGGCGREEVPEPAGPTYDATGRALHDVTRPATRPNLVVLVVDALRHDALPAVQGPDAVARMPHYAALATQGVTFENAVSASPWTLPSVTSLLTGLQPSDHGLHTPRSRAQLVASVTTFAEILETTYGYETAAWTAGSWFVGAGETILQGFGRREAGFGLHDAKRTLWPWAFRRHRGRPFFLFLHTYDVHHPYGAANHDGSSRPWPDVRSDPALVGPGADEGEIFRRCFLDAPTLLALSDAMGQSELATLLHRYQHRGYLRNPRPELAADLRRAYWEGARWADGLLGETVAWLRQQGLMRNTLLVITSDHGEGFGEHGSLAHGRLLYDELVRVPLVMLGPPPFGGGRRVEGDIGLVDVLPTFLDWAGLAPHVGPEGRSRLALLEGEAPCRPVLSEERLSVLNTGVPGERLRLAARTRRWKYVLDWDLETGSVREELYDLRRDPNEVEDLAGGAGRLPEGVAFDAVFCAAVQRLRARVWEVQASPGAEPTTGMPPPCRAGP